MNLVVSSDLSQVQDSVGIAPLLFEVIDAEEYAWLGSGACSDYSRMGGWECVKVKVRVKVRVRVRVKMKVRVRVRVRAKMGVRVRVRVRVKMMVRVRV